MTYYNVALYFNNGYFYHSPPGKKVWCYLDDQNNYYFGSLKVVPHYDNPAWNGQLFKTHSIRPWPGPVPVRKLTFEDIHGLIQNKL